MVFICMCVLLDVLSIRLHSNDKLKTDDRTLFKFLFKKKSKQQMLGLEIQADCINGIVVAYEDKKRPLLQKKMSFPYANRSMLGSALTHVINEAKCNVCSITLAPSFYQLLLLDAVDVSDSELGEAMKWRVSEINNRDVSDLVIDAFRLPADSYRGRMSMCYTAITEKPLIKEIVAGVESTKSSIVYIGINEISITQLIKNLPAFQGLNMVLIKPDKTGGMLCLMDSAQLYLCRTLEGNYGYVTNQNEVQVDDALVENLALDIQRSMDYYESQLGKDGIEIGLIFLDGESGLLMVDKLNEKLDIPITPFVLNDLFESSDEVCDPKFAPAIGAALFARSNSYVADN